MVDKISSSGHGEPEEFGNRFQHFNFKLETTLRYKQNDQQLREQAAELASTKVKINCSTI